jgi:hypothetical protein
MLGAASRKKPLLMPGSQVRSMHYPPVGPVTPDPYPEAGIVTFWRESDCWMAEWWDEETGHHFNAWKFLYLGKYYFENNLGITRWIKDSKSMFWKGFVK